MSYVLDALKKADAERERGSVPGLHAQPVPLSPDLAPPPSTQPWMWMVGGAMGAVVLCFIVWRLTAHDDAPAVTPVVAAADVSHEATPAVVTPPAPLQAPPPKVDKPTRNPTVASVPTRPATPPANGAATPPANGAATAPARPAASSTADARVPTQSELPDDLKRGIPALAVGGSIYSDVPSGRFLIINGQIFHEGDKLAPDLVLEQIRLKLAVLRYKGTRFSIAY